MQHDDERSTNVGFQLVEDINRRYAAAQLTFSVFMPKILQVTTKCTFIKRYKKL